MLGECFHINKHVTASISEDYCGVQMLAYPILHASAMKTGTMCHLAHWLLPYLFYCKEGCNKLWGSCIFSN